VFNTTSRRFIRRLTKFVFGEGTASNILHQQTEKEEEMQFRHHNYLSITIMWGGGGLIIHQSQNQAIPTWPGVPKAYRNVF
jgi:hypothetical protein